MTIALLAVLFPLPPLLAGVATGLLVSETSAAGWAIAALVASALACAATALAYLPTLRYFGLTRWRAATLPLAGCLFGAMTIDSALRSRRAAW